MTIIGTGLLGGSVGLALRKGGFTGRIVGTGPRMATLERAKAGGCVQTVTTDTAQAVRGSNLIVIAAPVSKIPSLLESLSACAEGDAVITDVGSTKASIVQAAGRVLKHPQRFVGSHPMAGAETTGPEAARADLFRDKPVIVTPTEATSPEAIDRVESLWRGLGMHIHRMTPPEHDRLVAVISHVPHAASALLVKLAEESGALPVASTGFADMTRLAGGDPQLWADIFLDNRAAVLQAVERWASLTDEFRQALQAGDRGAILRLLHDSQTAREAWRNRPKGQA